MADDEGGWLRLKQIALVTTDLELVLDQLAAVFGLRVAFRDPMVADFGLHNAVLPIGHQFLEVVAPIEPNTAAGRYLVRRSGPGGYMVIIHCDDQDGRRRWLSELGVRTAFEFEHDGFRCLQLHPADTGGTFFEIDQQVGSDNPTGPWAPAGPRWQGAVSTQLIDRVRAVRIQCADPSTVAGRWSAITRIPLSGELHQRLELDDGALEFVPLADERGDGLTAVVVRATDLDRAIALAEEHGLRSAEREITISGTRFVLVPA
jgi:Glyoxalase-like domain